MPGLPGVHSISTLSLPLAFYRRSDFRVLPWASSRQRRDRMNKSSRGRVAGQSGVVGRVAF